MSDQAVVRTRLDECEQNPYGDFHCWHWIDNCPTAMGASTFAQCCWCEGVQLMGYGDIVRGRIGVTPSGSVHGPYEVRR